MSNLQRFLIGCFVGGPLVIAQVTSFAFAIASVLKKDPNFIYAFLLVIVSIISALLALKVMGFWGRWSIVLLFYVCPLIVILDYVYNPLYPSGTVFIVGAYCLYFIFKKKNA